MSMTKGSSQYSSNHSTLTVRAMFKTHFKETVKVCLATLINPNWISENSQSNLQDLPANLGCYQSHKHLACLRVYWREHFPLSVERCHWRHPHKQLSFHCYVEWFHYVVIYKSVHRRHCRTGRESMGHFLQYVCIWQSSLVCCCETSA